MIGDLNLWVVSLCCVLASSEVKSPHTCRSIIYCSGPCCVFEKKHLPLRCC